MLKCSTLLKTALSVTLLASLAGAGGVFWVFHRAQPSYEGREVLAGLSASVEVYRDEHGVPHIFAPNMKDAVRALGYVHASERLFQMEMQRRAGQGRLAEIVGADMLGVDKFTRTLGLYSLAQSSFAAMSPEAQDFFQAYAEGVNSWLATHQKTLPPEFLVMNFKPEPWQPADSVVWGKLMALELSHNYKMEILRAQLAKTGTQEKVENLFPVPPQGSPITTVPHAMQKTDAFDQLGKLTGLDHGASNEWVVSGSRTESGKPLLANDPHLGLEAPVLWYLARLVTPEFSIKGATVPGLPIVMLGQNDHIAWGFTTTYSDVQDLFIETVDPKNADQYLTPKGSQAFDVRNETIHVKGAADTVLKVRTTRHGPVLSDIDPDMAELAGGGHVMALAFTGLGAKDLTSEALMRLDRASNWKEFQQALTLYQSPPQNLVYADVEGNIGFFNPGLVPIRKQGQGMVPTDGASGATDWVGMIPFAALPQLYNPAAGFVFNANNALVGADSKYFLGADWEESYRAQRLQQFFDTVGKHSLVTSAMMQADHVSLAARQLLPFLLQAQSTTPRAAEALAMLRGWDGVMEKDRPEPLIFEAWLYEMHQLLLVEKTGNSLKDKGPYSASALAFILANKASEWCSDAACAELMGRALDKAIVLVTERDGQDMKAWQWGHEHVAVLHNKVFSHVPLLSWLIDLSLPSSGDFYTLDRGGSFDLDPNQPFARTHGGGFRGLYDLGDPSKSRFMITTGESGHIFSKHYGDLVPLWNEVKSFELSGTREELAGRGADRLVLEP